MAFFGGQTYVIGGANYTPPPIPAVGTAGGLTNSQQASPGRAAGINGYPAITNPAVFEVNMAGFAVGRPSGE